MSKIEVGITVVIISCFIIVGCATITTICYIVWDSPSCSYNTVPIEGRCVWNSEYGVRRCDYSTVQTLVIEDGGVRIPNVVCPKCLSEMVWYGKTTRIVNELEK